MSWRPNVSNCTKCIVANLELVHLLTITGALWWKKKIGKFKLFASSTIHTSPHNPGTEQYFISLMISGLENPNISKISILIWLGDWNLMSFLVQTCPNKILNPLLNCETVVRSLLIDSSIARGKLSNSSQK